MPDEIVKIDRNTLAGIITSLKSLDVKGWDSMDSLVGCVLLLEKAFYAEEEVKDG